MNYSEYKSFLIILSTSDDYIENTKYKECLNILDKYKKKDIPFGLEPSYYSNLAECYLNLGEIGKCKKYFKTAFKFGLPEKYFEQLYLNYDTNRVEYNKLFRELKTSFYFIRNKLKTSEKLALNSKIIELHNNDQSVRLSLSEAIKKGDTVLINKCIKDLVNTDIVNQYKYDSLCYKYNWITKELYFYDFRKKPLMIIYHSEQPKIIQYINKGFDLATKNKIYWNELFDLQVYSIFKDVIYQKPENIFIIETLNINDDVNNVEKSNFVIDALFSNYVSYIKNFQEKKIEFYINTNQKDTDSLMFNKVVNIKNKLISQGANENQLVINPLNYLIFDNSKKNNTVGVKFL